MHTCVQGLAERDGLFVEDVPLLNLGAVVLVRDEGEAFRERTLPDHTPGSCCRRRHVAGSLKRSARLGRCPEGGAAGEKDKCTGQRKETTDTARHSRGADCGQRSERNGKENIKITKVVPKV